MKIKFQCNVDKSYYFKSESMSYNWLQQTASKLALLWSNRMSVCHLSVFLSLTASPLFFFLCYSLKPVHLVKTSAKL